MNLRRWIQSAGAAATAAALLLAAAAAAEASPELKCQAAKNLEAGKYALCRQKAEARLARLGDQLKYAAAIAKCDAKYGLKWQKAEDKAAKASAVCPSSADEASMKELLTGQSRLVAHRLSGGPRFTDNGDGTITDHETALMWEKKAGYLSGSDYLDPHRVTNWYHWSGWCSISSTLCQPNAAAAAACGSGVGCAECGPGDGTCDIWWGFPTIWEWLVQLNGASFAGHSDWRVPTREELRTIVDHDTLGSPRTYAEFHTGDCHLGCIDPANPICSCTYETAYWSASSSAPYPNSAWYVDFGASYPYWSDKSGGYYARAVRTIW